MLLEKAILENFRQYFGKQEIAFSTSPTENITIIYGVNGAGKTNLFNAMNWCLYGSKKDENSDIPGIEIQGQIASKALISELREGDKSSVATEIFFTHEGDKYNARREVICYKRNGELETDYNSENFSLVKIYPSGDSKTIPNPTNTINSILPQTAGKYFLFDGERIDEFARPGKENEIKEAIYQVLGLVALQRAIGHLHDASKVFSKELKQTSTGQLETLAEEEENIEFDIQEAVKKYNSIKNELSQAEIMKENIAAKIRGFEKAQPIIDKLEELDQQKESLEEEEKELKAEMTEYISRGSIVLAGPLIKDSYEFLEEKRKKGDIPSNIKEQFIRELIDRGSCICGREIRTGSNEHLALENLLKNTTPDSEEDEILSTIPYVRTLFESTEPDLKKNLFKTQKMRHGIKLRKEAIEKEKEEKEENLKSLGTTRDMNIKPYTDRRITLQGEIVELNTKKTRLINLINGFRTDHKKKQEEIEKAKTINQRNELAKRKKILAEKAKEAIERLHDRFAEDKRLQIQQGCVELFRKMIWKESQFQDVKLTTDYKLEVFDRFGLPARHELSAGERELLSLAFIAAMANASGSDAPFIIDTPFGRISEKPRANIARHMPEMTRQLVLFVTDVEVTPEAETEFRVRTGKEYTLFFDDTLGTTKIEVGKHV